MENELVILRLEIKKVKSVVEMNFAPHCSSGMLTPESHLLHHLVKSLEKIGNLPLMDVWPFEHSNELFFCRMTFGRLLTRMPETTENMSTALYGVQRVYQREVWGCC